MRFLSQVVASAYCPASVASLDRFFSVGCRMVGSFWLPSDAADAAAVARQAAALARSPRAPWEPDGPIDGIFNDLFSPFREEADGKLYVWIPVPVEESLSSTLLGMDWRSVALAWWATSRVGLDQDRTVIVSAFDSAGRVVSTDMVAEDIYGAMSSAFDISPSKHERPGAACLSCGRSAECKAFAAHCSDIGRPLPQGANDQDGMRALRLYSERAEVSLRLEALERRRDALDSELVGLIRGGRLRLGTDEELEVPTRTTASWDIRAVRDLLEPRGLWKDSMATLKVGELKRAMEKMPKEVAGRLEKMKSERTSQPSISEASRHGRFATRPSAFGGVSLKGKGGLGKG